MILHTTKHKGAHEGKGGARKKINMQTVTYASHVVDLIFQQSRSGAKKESSSGFEFRE